MNDKFLQCPYCPNQKEADQPMCKNCYDEAMQGSECVSVRSHLKSCSVCKSMFKNVVELN
ncbi:MAG: hypothetical protein AABY22_34385 [Nanoarchaeota archaeon]